MIGVIDRAEEAVIRSYHSGEPYTSPDAREKAKREGREVRQRPILSQRQIDAEISFQLISGIMVENG